MVFKKGESKMIGTKLAPLELQKIQEIVDSGFFINTSDFVREAIREKLQSIKLVSSREEVSYAQAKKEVLDYFEKHGEAYFDEAANDLELDLEMVYTITQELKKENRLEVVE